MARNVRVVMLCEDSQHETFIRQFLKARFNIRDLRVEKAPQGRGSGEQFVRERFPVELKALRSKGAERVYLIVMTDGDDQGVAGRMSLLKAACENAGVAPLRVADRVLICVPTWNIETWLAYLRGEIVDESRGDYRKYTRESECATEVEALVAMCNTGALRHPCPPSLQEACDNYRRVFG